MIVEICANSFESAKAAQKGGAGRIELCTQLAVGGLTPSREEVMHVLNKLSIETHVLIRPRKGNFMYSETELNAMIQDIEFCKKNGCAGVVSGVLTKENNIDLSATDRLIKAAAGMDFTFHRAFDTCREPKQEIENLIYLGVKRLLSSGQNHKAIDGLDLLIELNGIAKSRLEVMPGSGINSENALTFKQAEFSSIHLSATSNKISAVNNSSFFDTGSEGISDTNVIKTIVAMMH